MRYNILFESFSGIGLIANVCSCLVLLIHLYPGCLVKGYAESNTGSFEQISHKDSGKKGNRMMIYDIEKEDFVPASDDYQKARERVNHFKEENGKAPNLNDYHHIIFDEGFNLTGEECTLLWYDICHAQQTSITKDDISRLYLAKRDSIKDVFVDFTLENGRNSVVKECKYAVKENRMFLYETKKMDSEGKVSHRLSALNKADFRYVLFSDSSTDAGIQNRTGMEFEGDGLCIEMPLVQSMIFDQTLFRLNWETYDMTMLLRDKPNLQIMEKQNTLKVMSA